LEDDLTNLLISESELRRDEYPLNHHLQRIASSIDTPPTKLLPHLSSPLYDLPRDKPVFRANAELSYRESGEYKRRRIDRREATGEVLGGQSMD